MSHDDDQKQDGGLSGRLTSAFRRRPEDRHVISDYRVGDVREDRTVLVRKGAILVGDLLAPEVEVSGIVYGYVSARRLIVASGGQVWGDVYVSSLEMAPSGKINGWTCTLDPGTVDLLRAKELSLGDLVESERLPRDLLTRIRHSGADVEADQEGSQRRSGIWRQLRSEAALELIARHEIELAFDQRLEEALSRTTGTELEVEEAQVAPESVEEPQLPGEVDRSVVVAAGLKTEKTQFASGASSDAEQIKRLRTQLRQATAAAQKYYSELLWTRAELRAARREDASE